MYYDFHCHILPGIDDGAADVGMSVRMLDMQKKCGVGKIVATPHFYLSEQSIESFIDNRRAAFEKIRMQAADRGIELILGAEVLFTESLADRDLTKLCIGNTKYMLIELPYIKLSGRFIRSFRSFAGSIYPDILLILAHAERYLNFTDEEDIYEIIGNDMLVQLNCGSFKAFSPHRKFLFDLLEYNMAHFLGTDCHNVTSRPPNLDIAMKAIRKKASPECFDRLMKNAETVISGGIV